MTPEERAAYISSQVACALIEMNAMLAENLQVVALGEMPPCGRDDFLALVSKYNLGHNSVIKYLKE